MITDLLSIAGYYVEKLISNCSIIIKLGKNHRTQAENSVVGCIGIKW